MRKFLKFNKLAHSKSREKERKKLLEKEDSLPYL